MTALRKPLLSPRFLRFVLSGGIAAAVNVLSRIALSAVTSYSAAIVIAYLIGMTTAYVLMKLFVFEASRLSAHQEYLRFALVNLVALAQVWAVSLLFARIVLPAILPGIPPETPAHLIGVLSPVATSYFLHKSFSFSRGTPS